MLNWQFVAIKSEASLRFSIYKVIVSGAGVKFKAGVMSHCIITIQPRCGRG